MSGSFLAASPCVICRNVFTYNPERVPSMMVGALAGVEGKREPVCRGCVPEVNAELARLGRTDRLTILPGSYDMEIT